MAWCQSVFNLFWRVFQFWNRDFGDHYMLDTYHTCSSYILCVCGCCHVVDIKYIFHTYVILNWQFKRQHWMWTRTQIKVKGSQVHPQEFSRRIFNGRMRRLRGQLASVFSLWFYISDACQMAQTILRVCN